MSSGIIYIARCVLQANEEFVNCSPYENIAGGVKREGFACTLLFLSVLSISFIHAASGLFWGAMQLLAFVSR